MNKLPPLMLLAALPLAAVEQSSFRYIAPIRHGLPANTPVGIALPRGVIEKTNADLSDLRLFDNSGGEVPYVIYDRIIPQDVPRTFDFRVEAFSDEGGIAELVLAKPPSAGKYHGVEIVTAARDFRKTVRIDGSRDAIQWKPVATDVIFDYSSRINLRKTTITFNDTDANYLKMTLDDTDNTSAEERDISLRYQDLQFTVKGASPAETFKIDRVTGQSGRYSAAGVVYDSARVPVPVAVVDKDGNSVITMKNANLPLEGISLEIDNPFYYRRVDVYVSDEDEDASYRRVGGGTVYKIPGMNDSETSFSVRTGKRKNIRMIIINGDNQPLNVKTVEVKWVKKVLYFVPEPGARYKLYFSADKVSAPVYDLKRLLPSEKANRDVISEILPDNVMENPDYAPPPKTWAERKAGYETTIFTIVIMVLVAVMGLWIYGLMKKVGRASKE